MLPSLQRKGLSDRAARPHSLKRFFVGAFFLIQWHRLKEIASRLSRLLLAFIAEEWKASTIRRFFIASQSQAWRRSFSARLSVTDGETKTVTIT
jgi:hypothetical protein